MPDHENPLMNGMIELEAIDDVSLQRRDLIRGAGVPIVSLGTSRAVADALRRSPEFRGV